MSGNDLEDHPKIKKKMVITPDLPGTSAEYQDNSCSNQSMGGGNGGASGSDGYGANFAYDDNLYQGRGGGRMKDSGSPNGMIILVT